MGIPFASVLHLFELKPRIWKGSLFFFKLFFCIFTKDQTKKPKGVYFLGMPTWVFAGSYLGNFFGRVRYFSIKWSPVQKKMLKKWKMFSSFSNKLITHFWYVENGNFGDFGCFFAFSGGNDFFGQTLQAKNSTSTIISNQPKCGPGVAWGEGAVQYGGTSLTQHGIEKLSPPGYKAGEHFASGIQGWHPVIQCKRQGSQGMVQVEMRVYGLWSGRSNPPSGQWHGQNEFLWCFHAFLGKFMCLSVETQDLNSLEHGLFGPSTVAQQ